MQTTVNVYANKKIKVMPAPCLRTVPELYIGETYFLSFDGKNAHSYQIDRCFLGGKNGFSPRSSERIEAYNWTEIGANRSWAIRNQVINKYENYN